MLCRGPQRVLEPSASKGLTLAAQRACTGSCEGWKYSWLRFLWGYPEQSTYSSADFLRRAVKWFARRGIRVECVQTDNGFEFTNRFSNSRWDLPTLFERTAKALGIRHKLIRPYTPRHNGKTEGSHREARKRFYSCHPYYFPSRI